MTRKWIRLVKKLCLYGTSDIHFLYSTPCVQPSPILLPQTTVSIWLFDIVPLLHFIYSWTVWHWPAANFVRACCLSGCTHRHDKSLKPFLSPAAGNAMSIPLKNKHVAETWEHTVTLNVASWPLTSSWQLVWLECWKERSPCTVSMEATCYVCDQE